MRTRGDKLLLGFLALGILFYVLTIPIGQETPVDASRNIIDADPDTSISPLVPFALPLSPMAISLKSYDFAAEAAGRRKLPNSLREISGLAMTDDDRLFAHADEKGVIFELDYRNGSVVKSFALADQSKPVSGDFEGIAVVDSLIYLVTSAGRLYEFRDGVDGQAVLFTVYTTGVGRDYEIEGLAYEPDRRSLLLMSKHPRSAAQKGFLTIFHWSIDTKQLADDAHLRISILEFSRYVKGEDFRPSGIERHPVSGNYFVVAARERAIVEITPHGEVLAGMIFPAHWHRQIEGIAFASDNTLIVSDEGAGKRAQLTLYPILGDP
jgi:uncharacterized protein YjiK